MRLSVFLMGGPVPETREFLVPGYVRSGNLAIQGIAEGLMHAGVGLTCYAVQSIQAFPRFRRLWCRRQTLTHPSGLVVRLIPSINVLLIREFMRGFYAFFAILAWSLRNRRTRRCIVVYNLFNPPFGFLLAAARLCRCPIIPIIFDIGMPPHSMGGFRNWIYRRVEVRVPRYLQSADGLCVIVEPILKRYAPERHALLLDGGVSTPIQARLFPLDVRGESAGDAIVLVCAGSLYPHNGTSLVLDMLRINRNPRIRVHFAGSGPDVASIEAFAREDARVTYEGALDLDGLFKLYQMSDAVLNIRVTRALDTSTWFPSKVIEALAVGRLVLTTDVAHLRPVYGANCLILDEETPQAFSCLVDRVLAMSREERDVIGRKAQAFMLREHTWDHQMQRVVRYCEGICAGKYEQAQGLVNI